MAVNVNAVFNYDESFTVTPDVQRSFDVNGYVILKGLLSEPEVSKLKTALEDENGLITRRYTRDDGEGRQSKAVLWNQPGNDLTGCIARSEKVAGTFDKLLGGEVYHYHSKVIMKEARTGGAHIWHQDYGYWYENACMFPYMGTVWIAVDKATKENGCLKVLKGSHLLGRIEHKKVGLQVGADLERVKLAHDWCELVHMELEPGDALFFHCNVLHRSDHNNSENRRWGFLVSYNRADNNPVYEHHHARYTKLHRVPNSAILECSTTLELEDKDFFGGPDADFSFKRVPNSAILECSTTLELEDKDFFGGPDADFSFKRVTEKSQ